MTGLPTSIQTRHIPSGSDIFASEQMKQHSHTVYSGMKSAKTGAQAQGSIGHEVDAPTYPLHHDTRESIQSRLTNVRDTGKPHRAADLKGKLQTIHTADLTIDHTPGTFHIQSKGEGALIPALRGHTP